MWCQFRTPASPFLWKSFGGNHAWQTLQSHLAWCVKKSQLARGKSESETPWMWCQTSIVNNCVSSSLTVSLLDSTGAITSEFWTHRLCHHDPRFSSPLTRHSLTSRTIPSLKTVHFLWEKNIPSGIHFLYVQIFSIFYLKSEALHRCWPDQEHPKGGRRICVKVNKQEKISPE